MKIRLLIFIFFIAAFSAFAQVANQPSDLAVCDDDNDGFALFDLTIVSVEILGSQNPSNYTITYHETLNDAETNTNAISSPYANIVASIQTIYAKVEENSTGNYDITSFNLIVELTPQVTTVSDFVFCELNTDGFGNFILSQKNTEVLSGQDPALFDVSYYETLADADSQVNAISSNTSYSNTSNPQTIYARVTNNIAGCYAITNFDLVVNDNCTPCQINTPSAYEVCDDDNDGIAIFDLTIKDAEITGGDSNLIVSYYLTQADANNGITISNPTAYTNTSNPQTLFVRAEGNATSCSTITTLTLRVLALPTPNPQVSDLVACDDDADGFTVFDLESKTLEILNGEAGVFATYHETQSDAENGTNTLTSPYANVVSNSQIIYARVENGTTGCYTTVSFELIVDPNCNPCQINTPSTYEVCDDNNDGFASFDLSTKDTEITAGNTDLLVSYYATQADADAAQNALPSIYNNISSPQTIYARVDGQASGCTSSTNFTISVASNPISNVNDNYELCQGETIVVDTGLSVENFSFVWEFNGILIPNEIQPSLTVNAEGAYSVMVTNNSLDCSSTTTFLVTEVSCVPCQDITATIDSTTPEPNASGVVVTQVNNTVSFSGSATFSNDGTGAAYTWNFDDGSTSTGETVTHQYTQEGSYNVVLTVTDATPEACTATATITVNVLGDNLVVNQSQFTVQELIEDVLLGNQCSQVSNISYSTGSNFGDTNGIGYFVYEGNGFPFSEGVILSNGDANDANGPNTSLVSSGSANWQGDADLDNALGSQTFNASYIEFDFVPVVDEINFEFLMASEEYNNNFECQFSDAFAFLLTDALGNISNLAIVPGTDTPISTTTVRPDVGNSCAAVNPEYFGGYNADTAPINYNGQTVVFTAQAQVNIGETYHIKLVIADNADSVYDSAVFLKAGSLDIGGLCDDIGLINMKAFNDVDTDGNFDTDETSFTNGTFTYEKNNDGIINEVNISNGSYTIVATDPNDTYDITFTVNDDYTTCYSQSITAFDDVSVALGDITQVAFPVIDNLTCTDLAVYLINPSASPRPGFEHTNLLYIQNLSGATIASGSVDFELDANLLINNIVVSNSNMNITTTATGFTLDFTNLGAGAFEYVDITLQCPASVPLGEIVTNVATYATDDLVANNNVSTLSEIVIGSYDPNDKMEAHGPEIVYDDFTTTDEYLYYTIRFQNVGTAEAVFVRIEDVLDSQLDETTFQMLRASDDYSVTRTGNNLEWYFDTINLPAEQDDADGSMGYVYFRIKPKAGYAIGDIIPNNAAIYFDFNAPIITNTFNTEFTTAPLSVDTFNALNFKMYPNPTSDHVVIDISNYQAENLQLRLYDILGKEVSVSLIFNSESIEFNVASLSTGMYFVKLSNGTQSSIQKLSVK